MCASASQSLLTGRVRPKTRYDALRAAALVLLRDVLKILVYNARAHTHFVGGFFNKSFLFLRFSHFLPVAEDALFYPLQVSSCQTTRKTEPEETLSWCYRRAWQTGLNTMDAADHTSQVRQIPRIRYYRDPS